MANPSCGCPVTSAGVLHTFECQMSGQQPIYAQRQVPSGVGRFDGTPLAVPTDLDINMDPWDKGILVNLVMTELKLGQLRNDTAGKVPTNAELIEHVTRVLDRFRMNYSRPLMAELVNRVGREILGG